MELFNIPIFKCRASAAGILLSDPIGKSNLEKYNDAVQKVADYEKRLSEFKDKSCKTAIQIRDEKLPQAILLVNELEAIKDEIELSETAKEYIHTWLKEYIYGVKKELNTKEIRKGIEFEYEAIDKAIDWCDLEFQVKNEKNFEDDYFTGTPDLILSDEIPDIKNSWSWETFPLFDKTLKNKGYAAQDIVYMHLTGKRKGSIIYILLDTPETAYTMPILYSNVDPKLFRAKKFNVEFDSEIIEELKKRVINARKYIQNLLESFV